MKDKLLKELEDAILNINTAEEHVFTYINTLDEIQNKIMDVEHYLESHEITRSGSIELMNLLTQLRKDRRQVKQMWEIWNTYGINREKLKQKDYRCFLISELHKTDKALDTQYKNRAFDMDYLDSLNEEKRLPRKKKEISYNNGEEVLLDEKAFEEGNQI